MKWILLSGVVLSIGGCCVITCNGRLPNSYVKVASPVQADCTYEDRLGVREFSSPGEVLAMPSNAPGKLNCKAKGYKPFGVTLAEKDWQPLTPISGDPDAMRYFSEVELKLEPLGSGSNGAVSGPR